MHDMNLHDLNVCLIHAPRPLQARVSVYLARVFCNVTLPHRTWSTVQKKSIAAEQSERASDGEGRGRLW